jgi:hemerythrin-like domain-containing protein
MRSVIDLHPGPGAGFDQPFEMLDACHQRVEHMLVLLGRLSAHLGTHGADEQAQQAARDVMRYFDLAAPQHHEDEERHVLPRLRECGQAALAERVLREHTAMAAAWAEVRAALQGVEQGRRPVDGTTQARQWPAFAALYREHIALEEREVFPTARAHTSAEGLRAMADEMARRRGAR